MKLIGYFVATFVIGFSSALLLRDNDSALEREIMRNEQVCTVEKRPGYNVYTVTRYGELRGCIRVQESGPDGIRPAPILIVKRVDM